MEIVKDVSIKIFNFFKKLFNFIFSGDLGVHFFVHFALGVLIMFVTNYLNNYTGRAESNQKFAEALGNGNLYKVMPYIMTFCYPFATLVWRQTIGRLVPSGFSISGYGDTFILVAIILFMLQIFYLLMYTLILWLVSPYVFPFGVITLIIMRVRDTDLA